MGAFHPADRPVSVLLVGGFGSGDPAQESLLDAFLAALPDAEVTVASRDPRATIARHAAPAVPGDSLTQLLPAVNRSSAVVFAGGTVFTTRAGPDAVAGPSPLRTATTLASFAHARGTSVLAVGVASGELPSRSARLLGREFARLSDLLVLRDETSAQRLIDAGVPPPMRVGADPTWTLADQWPLPADAADDAVVVVPGLGPDAGNRDVAAVAELLDALGAEGLRIRLDPWSADRGAPTAARRAGVEVAPLPRNLGEAANRLVGARLVIALRLHAQIAAAVAGVPCLSIAYETDQVALANRLGQPWVSPRNDIPTTAAAARRALGAPPATAAAVKAEIVAAHAGFDLLRLMLGDGDGTGATVDGLRLEPNL